MVPSNYDRKQNIGVRGRDKDDMGKQTQKLRYSQPPLMNRHNRGDLSQEGQKKKKKKVTEPRGNEKLEKNKHKKVQG